MQFWCTHRFHPVTNCTLDLPIKSCIPSSMLQAVTSLLMLWCLRSAYLGTNQTTWWTWHFSWQATSQSGLDGTFPFSRWINSFRTTPTYSPPNVLPDHYVPDLSFDSDLNATVRDVEPEEPIVDNNGIINPDYWLPYSGDDSNSGHDSLLDLDWL